MASSDAIIPEQVLQHYDTVPIVALKYGARKLLAKYLNIPKEIPTDEGYLPDYTGVAEVLGFDYADQKNFEMKPEPTLALLDAWQGKRDATVGKLCRILLRFNRLDVLSHMSKVFERDVKDSVEKRKEWRELSAPVQDDTVSQSSRSDGRSVDPFRYMVNDDIGADRPCMFDAFVCSAHEDLPFVKEMIQQLEATRRLRLCIPERDLLPGGSDGAITGNLIEQRCNKMIAVMSPNYLDSTQCDFQTHFAHALSPGSRSKKVIPVLFKACTIPSVLRHITFCDYTRPEVQEWFWLRLANAIKAPVKHGSVDIDQNIMGAVRLNLDSDSYSSFTTDTSSVASSC